MKSTVPRLITLVVAAALALARFAAGAPPTADYELLFAEEFDGDRVNVQDWSFRTGFRTGTGINGLNLAANVVVADGHLVIAAKQETVNGRVENTGGGLIGKHRFGFGYYECRSQPFMGGRGVHSAFWQRGLGEENNAIFEIDSYELDSTSRIASNNLYVDVSPSGFMDLAWPHRANVPLTLPADGWFIDAYEYTPEGVVFYDHGRVVARVDLAGLVAAQNIWLTALNGVGTVDAARLPGVTRFDYFRYYARDYPGVNLLANGALNTTRKSSIRSAPSPGPRRVTSPPPASSGAARRTATTNSGTRVPAATRFARRRRCNSSATATTNSAPACAAAPVKPRPACACRIMAVPISRPICRSPSSGPIFASRSFPSPTIVLPSPSNPRGVEPVGSRSTRFNF
jgi:hypothetical protein